VCRQAKVQNRSHPLRLVGGNGGRTTDREGKSGSETNGRVGGRADWWMRKERSRRQTGWVGRQSMSKAFDVGSLTDESCSCGRSDSRRPRPRRPFCRGLAEPGLPGPVIHVRWIDVRDNGGRRWMSAPDSSCCQNVIRIYRADGTGAEAAPGRAKPPTQRRPPARQYPQRGTKAAAASSS